MKPKQPSLHLPGWPECRFYGEAKTDGLGFWWYEEPPQEDGSILKRPLMSYKGEARG
jgi:hypothetical protein